MRFVFRRSGSLIGIYVGLVLAYGSIALTTSGVSVDAIKYTLIGMVTASALLHFYYDGFIWKVRETQTRAMLGIDASGVSTLPAPRAWPGWVRHSVRWAVLVVPVAALCAAQLGGRVVPTLERTAKVAEILPQDPQAQLNYGKALHDAGRVNEAVTRYEFAISKNPALAEAEFFLGLAWNDLGDADKSIEHYEKCLRLDSNNPKGECNLAGVLVSKGRLTEARKRYEHSLSLNPNLQIAHKELADLLVGSGEYQAAVDHYESALRIQPDFIQARQNLSFARSLAGR
jgi:tetratricopeptide (TPR) repeat protein